MKTDQSSTGISMYSIVLGLRPKFLGGGGEGYKNKSTCNPFHYLMYENQCIKLQTAHNQNVKGQR